MRVACVLLLTLGVLSAAPIPKDFKKPTDDKVAILGTWKAHRLTLNGEEDKKFDTYTFVFEADGKCHTFHGDRQRSDWMFSLDPTAKPKRLKWMDKEGRPAHECIYELEGHSMKLGFTTGEAVPPRVEPALNLTLYEMKREKPAK